MNLHTLGASSSGGGLQVIREEVSFRILDKPSGTAVLKDNTGAPSLSDLYPTTFGEPPLWVHRLDKGTSGVLLIARTQPARADLQKQFNLRCVEKTYLALVEGSAPSKRGVVGFPIEKARKGKFRIARSGGGASALTEFEVLETNGVRTLLLCRPTTGRTHQIRVHLAAIGCPLVSDPLYGTRRARPSREPFLSLHAWKLGFRDPETGGAVEAESPKPPWALEPFSKT